MIRNFLFILSLFGFGIRIIVALQDKLRNVYPSSIYWKRMYPIGVNSPRKLCGSGDFLEILNYRINFLNTYRANYNIYFLLSLWYFVFIEKLVHFIYVVKFLYVELFTKISYSFDALGVCSDSFCFIHNIDNLCVLFCFVSLARDLVIFLIFSKIQIFIFFIVLFSISLVSDLNYISFFLLALGIFCPSFSRFFK